MKNKLFLEIVMTFGLVFAGCTTDSVPAAEVSEKYDFFPKSISLSFYVPENADQRITKVQYEEARISGSEFYQHNNSDGTTSERFFTNEWRYWFWSGNDGEYGRMGYFEPTKDQIAEIIQAMSLPSEWTYRYEISDDKVPSIHITLPGGIEGEASYYWLEPLNPMEYQYCDANGEWHGPYFIQALTK